MAQPRHAGHAPDPVRVYALAHPALVARHQRVVERAVMRVLGVSDPAKHEVTVSESGGWIGYTAVGEVWERRTPPRLPTEAEALRLAEEFARELSAALSPANPEWPEELAGAVVAPPLLRPAEIAAVARPDGRGYDHWLYRAQPHLRPFRDRHDAAPVLGALLEVRVGEGGRVVAMSSRWRPLSGERLEAEQIPLATGDGHGGGHGGHAHKHGGGIPHGGGGKAPKHKLVYVLEGDGIPQYYLAPYHLVDTGHVLSALPASPYSLAVSVEQRHGEEGPELTARVQGGSGDYAFNWAAYGLDAVLEEGVVELGPGSTLSEDQGGVRSAASRITIPGGAHLALLNVKDRRTGAFKHHQQQVLSIPFGDEPGGAAAVA